MGVSSAQPEEPSKEKIEAQCDQPSQYRSLILGSLHGLGANNHVVVS